MRLENIFFNILICFLYELAKHFLLLVDSEFDIRILDIENEFFQEENMIHIIFITHIVFLADLIVAHGSNI